MNGNKYNVSIKMQMEAPPECAADQLEAVRRRADELYKILYSHKFPAAVDIEITVMPVQQRHIEYSKHGVERTAGTWRKFLNLVGCLAGSLRHR